MKFLLRFTTLSLVLLMISTSHPLAQSTGNSGSDTLAPGSTVITSDELRSDQQAHTSAFTGKVVVVGTNFKMTCQEMTVYFSKDNKVDHIVATGDVVITQPGRITHSGQAEYFRDDDKFVLTDQPMILDNKNQIEAPIITIFRTKQTLITSGGKSKVTMAPDNVTPTTPLPATDTK